jgi:hypothetical protein
MLSKKKVLLWKRLLASCVILTGVGIVYSAWSGVSSNKTPESDIPFYHTPLGEGNRTFGSIISKSASPAPDARYWDDAEQTALSLLELVSELHSARGIDDATAEKLKQNITEKLDISTNLYLKLSTQQALSTADIKDQDRFKTLDEQTDIILYDILSNKLHQYITPTPTRKLSKIITPTPSRKTSGFFENGFQMVEPGVIMAVKRVEPVANRNLMSAHVILASFAQKEMEIVPSRLQMVSSGGVTGGSFTVAKLRVGPLDIRSHRIDFEKFYDPPYTFTYLNSEGDTILMGTFK